MSVLGRKRVLTFALPLLTAACAAGSPLGAPQPELQRIDTAAQPATTPKASAGAGPAARTPTPAARAWTWLAFGDSITQDAFAAPLVAWTAGWQAPAPVVINAGIRGVDSAYALTQVDEILNGNPAAKYVGVGFGTNDVGHARTPEAFRAGLVGLVEHIRATGKTAMLATIPYSLDPSYQAISAYNPVVAEVNTRENLAAGPDLNAWFSAHLEQLGPDGLHMTAEGDQAIQRLWADAARQAGF